MLDEIIRETSFLLEHYESPTVNQMLFHYINNISEVLVCPICNNPKQVKPYNARITGEFYKGTCGIKECETKHRQIKTEEGIMSKYGASNIGQTKHWRDSVMKTNQEKRGVDWVTQSREDFVDNKEVINKRRQTFDQKYGKDTYTETSEFLDKRKETFNDNYGANHPMQNAEYFEKIAYCEFTFKNYKLPSGRVVKVQGYEPNALDILLKVYDESDLVIKDSNISKHIGSIMYEFEGKTRRYYPDIYIISEHKIIEVKSKYTYEKELDNNIAKMNACVLSGMSFEFMILDK